MEAGRIQTERLGGRFQENLVVKCHTIAKVVFVIVEIMLNKLTFEGFRRGDRPPGSVPDWRPMRETTIH